MSLVEPIAPYHDRKSFNCGKSSMNGFLLHYGLSQAYGSTWVVVPNPGASEIIAYYTVSPDPLDIVLEDEEDQTEATVIELDRLAVDVKYKRQGFGRRLLLRLMTQMLDATQQVPVDALSLITLDQEAKDWYMSLGFGFRETEPVVSVSSYLLRRSSS